MRKIILVCIACFIFGAGYTQKKRIILDADTANEVDDLFAIVRVAIDPNVEIIALNGTQWQSAHWTSVESMEDSHRLNQKLLGYLGLERKIKTLRGGKTRMYDWGDLAQHSAATYEIIKQAKAQENGKLSIIALGALTNVASAIFIDPSIQDKIELYWLGTSYDFETGKMGKVDFNCMMDQRALDVMLNSSVEMHVIPVSLASSFNFDYDATKLAMPMDHQVCWYLMHHWDQHLDAGRKTRTLWDLALIEAYIHPELATEQKVKTSIDSGNREIWYYKTINVEGMKSDYFETLNNYLNP